MRLEQVCAEHEATIEELSMESAQMDAQIGRCVEAMREMAWYSFRLCMAAKKSGRSVDYVRWAESWRAWHRFNHALGVWTINLDGLGLSIGGE